jgi:hypothetical protein
MCSEINPEYKYDHFSFSLFTGKLQINIYRNTKAYRVQQCGNLKLYFKSSDYFVLVTNIHIKFICGKVEPKKLTDCSFQ